MEEHAMRNFLMGCLEDSLTVIERAEIRCRFLGGFMGDPIIDLSNPKTDGEIYIVSELVGRAMKETVVELKTALETMYSMERKLQADN